MREVSLALALALAPEVPAQSFGRFGYVENHAYQGLSYDREGIGAEVPGADRLRFYLPTEKWQVTRTSAFGQTVSLGRDRFAIPNRLRVSLLGAGVSLYFPNGLRFRLRATAAPYVTWEDGSGSTDVPTPRKRWIALSFRDNQPAVLFGFPDEPGSLRIVGKPGAWEVRADDFRGWVRIALPRGTVGEPTNTASALGRLAQFVRANAPLWTQPVPDFRRVTAEAEPTGDGVLATWEFTGGGFVLPEALTFAPVGGYRVRVLSPTREIPAGVGFGDLPRQVSTDATLKVRFPIRRVPIGRALAVGEPSPGLGTVSFSDVPSLAELALENLLAGSEARSRKLATDAFAEFIAQATYTKEPLTQQSLPFDETGAGMDLVAAHALLNQALITTTKATSEANSLLTTLNWRRDWDTWLPYVADSDLRRRSAALAAIAAALCPEPARRLGGGMLQAGLAAERGKQILLRRKGLLGTEPGLLEPLPSVRRALFRLGYPNPTDDPFVSALLSPLRLYGDEALQLRPDAVGLVMNWTVREAKAGTFSIAAGMEIALAPTANLPRFLAERQLGLTEVRYTPETAGRCEVRVTLPDWAVRLPVLVPAPRYEEPRN